MSGIGLNTQDMQKDDFSSLRRLLQEAENGKVLDEKTRHYISLVSTYLKGDMQGVVKQQEVRLNQFRFEVFPTLKEQVEKKLEVAFRGVDTSVHSVRSRGRGRKAVRQPPAKKLSESNPSVVRKVLDACLLEMKREDGKSYSEQLRDALILAIDANDFEKVDMLFRMGAEFSTEVCEHVLLYFGMGPKHDKWPKDKQILSEKIWKQLIRDVPPSMEILNVAYQGARLELVKSLLQLWKAPSFENIEPKWQSVLAIVLREGDLEFAEMLLKMGVKLDRTPDGLISDCIKKIDRNEMSDFISFFERLICNCGVVPRLYDFGQLVELTSISASEIAEAAQIFLKSGGLKYQEALEDSLFRPNLLNSKAVNEVFKLLVEKGANPTARFLESGLCLNVLSAESIQLCLGAGLHLSDQILNSFFYALVHSEADFDKEAIEKLQLFIDAGVAFDHYTFSLALEKIVPMDVLKLVCEHYRPDPSDMQMALYKEVSAEQMQVLIDAGGVVDVELVMSARSLSDVETLLLNTYNSRKY